MTASQLAVQIAEEVARQKAVAAASVYGDGPIQRKQLIATLESAYQTASLRELHESQQKNTLRK